MESLADELRRLDPNRESYASSFVDQLLDRAVRVQASDLHLQPSDAGLEIRWRMDGVLRPLGTFSRGVGSDIVTRLKVMSGLLTYRQDIPQEGRLKQPRGNVELRVSTFPSLHGERAVIRLFGGDEPRRQLADLSYDSSIVDSIRRVLGETSGAFLITGPAGSGKTTTAYACLRAIVQRTEGETSLVSLEDPIESVVPGVCQSQINEAAGFDFATGLRSLMRQDPEVILVGEIRDAVTSATAFQAALTGHLVLSTFHAGSAAGAVCRLRDMGIEPYVLRSGVLGIVNQRLVRRLCSCARRHDAGDSLGLPVEVVWDKVGCPDCLGSGFRGRLPLAELLRIESSRVADAILSRYDASYLEREAVAAGMRTRWAHAATFVSAGMTTPHEIRRVLGLGPSSNL